MSPAKRDPEVLLFFLLSPSGTRVFLHFSALFLGALGEGGERSEPGEGLLVHEVPT